MDTFQTDTRGVRLAELIAALSLATDLGTGQPMEHALRTCLLGLRLGERAGLSDRDLREVYYVALLRAVGCTADAHESATFFGDEIIGYARIALVDQNDPVEMLRFMLRHVGDGNSLARRGQMIMSALATGRKGGGHVVAVHCEVAQMLARELGMPSDAVAGLDGVYERWDGKGFPHQLHGDAIPLSARAVTLVRDADLFHRLGGVEAAVAIVRRRAGAMYDPALAACFCAEAERLLTAVDEASVWDAVLEAEPGARPVLNGERLDAALRAAADFADLKSAYTTGHSRGVAVLAEAAARHFGCGEEDCLALHRAGYLHDLGRVGVSAAIWDKPGPLTHGEREQVRLHPYYTERILARPAALARLGALAACHHERLDGSGYFRGVSAAGLPVAARILAAADVFHALTENRPHRPAHSLEAAAGELRREVHTGRLDSDAVNAVLAAAGQRARPVHREWPGGLSDREVEVLRLVATGLSNREMARRLIIAEKTVGHHIQHIYNKIGVSSRAAATLFAMQHDLLADIPVARE